MKIVVLGAGIMSRAAIFDLADDEVSPDVSEIFVYDLDGRKAEDVAKKASKLTSSKEINHGKLDVRDVDSTAEVLSDADVVINGVIYYYIPQVMEAALKAGANYLDLGSDVETLVRQQKMDPEFRDKGLVAIPGMGGSPGLINIEAKYAVERMDYVEKLYLREGWIDFNDYDSLGIPLPVPYSLDTIMDEFEDPVEVWEEGRLRYIPPFSGREEMEFPPPVGKVELYYVEHPEVYTLGETFKHKGLKFVDYKLSFPRDLYIKYKLLKDLGLSSTEPLDIMGVDVVPRDVIKFLVEKTLQKREIPPNDYDIMRVIALGRKDGKRAKLVVDIFIEWSKKWNVSAQALLVGSPASIAAQWTAKGIIAEPGVHNPEEVIEPIPFFNELKLRGMKFRESLEVFV